MNHEEKIKIRRAKLHEAQMLTDIALRAKRSNGYDDSFIEACKDELTVTTSHMKEGEYWVAELDLVCGFICLVEGLEPKVGEVHALFIEPNKQRCGVGKSLWLKIIEQAGSKGMVKIQLDADPAAVPFYESFGFKIIANVPSGSIPGRFIPRMETHLDL